jgi:hypothetical protein
MVGVHDRQPVSSLIKVLELTGRRRLAKAVASGLGAVHEPRKASNANACSMIFGDRRIWEQQDESLEAFEKGVEEEAKALHQTSGV